MKSYFPFPYLYPQIGLEKFYTGGRGEVKELNVFSLVRGTFIRVHKYLHGEKILGNKRQFNLAEKGRTLTNFSKLNSCRFQSKPETFN